MSQNNIENNLFGAIDVIITEKMKGLQFDLTKVCTITDASRSRDGAYTVTDGSITFEAYSENNTYKAGDAVRVSIPNADFAGKKYIVGKYVTDNSIIPITYVSPLESILDITNNLVSPEISTKIYEFYANEEFVEGNKTPQLTPHPIATIYPQIESLEISEIYDTFYIVCEFRTFLGDYDILDGNYGIMAVFHGEDQTHGIYLDSKDMFGDPYNFAVFTSQQQTYNIKKIKKIDKIDLIFYQYNNFWYNNNEGIVMPVPYEKGKSFPNIQIANLAVGFGAALSNVEDNTVKIYTGNSTEYNQSSISSCEKKVNLLWYNKNDFGKYIEFKDGSFTKDDGSPYDEFADYIAGQAKERSLMAYINDENVPHDQNGLEIAVALDKFNSTIDTTIKYIKDNVVPGIAKYRVDTGLKKDYNIETDITNIQTSQTNANKYIKKVLAWSASKYNPKDNALTEDKKIGWIDANKPTKFEITYITDISSSFTEIITTLENLMGNELDASYQGMKETFVKEVESWTSYIRTKSNSLLLPDTINNYLTDNYIFSVYGGDPLLPTYNNKYSIYWYRYDPQNLLDGNYYISGDSIVNSNWKRYKGYSAQTNYSFTANAQRSAEEHIMAVVFYNHEYYKSNVLTFTNTDADKIYNERNENLTASIRLAHGNNSKAVYQIYGESGNLLNSDEKYIEREVTLHFMNNDTTFDDDKLKNCQIYWYLPAHTTMLAASNKNTNFIIFTEGQSPYFLENYVCYYQSAGTDQHTNSFYYKIEDYYVQSDTRNHIKCKVVTPDKYEYDATINFAFSSFGTSGTDYTLLVSPMDGQSAVQPNKPLRLKIALYDYNNNNITDVTFKIAGILDNYETSFEQNNIIIVTKKTSNTNDCFGILTVEATVKGTTLQAFYPIAYAKGNYHIEGTTSIIYDSTGGSPWYYKDPYCLHGDGAPTNQAWTLVDESNSNTELEKSILPTITNNILKPCVMYVEGINIKPVAQLVDYYYQSIYIGQNRYPSAMLNSWDNSLTIDEDNGTILSQVVGAGKKVEDKFSGVFMGKVGKVDNSNNHSDYGLYGFHQGAQSFGFNVDGTAFLGKSGSGRIEFDGNSGTIESASYQKLPKTSGMKIDLDDGFIHMRGTKKTGKLQYENGTQSEILLSTLGDPYFAIKSKNGNPLLYVGDKNNQDNYFLQTDNFTESGSNSAASIVDSNNYPLTYNNEKLYVLQKFGSGTRIDLANGKIVSYDFTIDAQNPSGGKITLTSDNNINYPLNINDLFTVDWKGNISAQGGTIGKDNKGQLVINEKMNIGGGSIDIDASGEATINSDKKDNIIDIYLLKGLTSDNISNVSLGHPDNNFYIGPGGSIFRNTDINNDKIIGAKLDAGGLIVEGKHYDEDPVSVAFYSGNRILFANQGDQKSVLFEKGEIVSQSGRIEYGQNHLAITAPMISITALNGLFIKGKNPVNNDNQDTVIGNNSLSTGLITATNIDTESITITNSGSVEKFPLDKNSSFKTVGALRKSLENHISNYNKHIIEYNDHISNYNKHVIDYNDHISNYQTFQNNYSNYQQYVEKQLESLKNQISTVVTENTNLKATIQDKNNTIESLNSDISDLEDENSDLRSDISDLEDENSDLRDTIDTQSEKIRDQMREIEELKQQLGNSSQTGQS